jgi:hypothetical protein
MKDAQKLGDIYLQLQLISSELFEIMERHPNVIHVKKNLGEAMHGLYSIAHDIYREAHELKKEEDNDES